MREKLSMDRGWRFALGHAADESKDFEFLHSRCLVKAGEARGAAGTKFDDGGWRAVDVPHDWAMELPFDPKGDKELGEHGFHAIGPDHPEHSVGWYRRTFEVPESDLGRRISIEFDGVFRDSIVWVNGHRMGRHASGYTSFRYDVTDVVNYGGKNVVAVRADASSWEGWWYEGAGIYRHVWLVKTGAVHVGHWGTVVRCEPRGEGAEVTAGITVLNEGDGAAEVDVVSEVLDGERRVGEVVTQGVTVPAWGEVEVSQLVQVAAVKLWSCESPNLYTLRTTIRRGAQEVDRYDTRFGVRTLEWDAARGFFLNGKPVKIKGTCNHQNHAGVGIAMPDRLHWFRVKKLEEMGSNAYRCSHYAVAPELLDACDELGMLVMAENRLAGSGPEQLGQFESMIRRDRNHPSIILWSLANEEHTVQWSVAGERIGASMIRLAHRLDPTRQVTTAMHDRGLGEGFANVVDVHGWNYMAVGDIEAFHKRRPEQPIVGSEEASTVCTRGEYVDDEKRGYVSAYDVGTPPWGSTAEKWWTYFAERPWLAGGFVWTGFDYKGEPIPYQWPCTGSHFGLMDQCGFPKDNYYYYKAWWGDRPVLHVFPHWNWAGKEGQEIDVRCFTNCERVELFLNGRSLGVREVKRNSHAAWRVPYAAGVLEAQGFVGDRKVIEVRRQTAGEPVRLVLTSDRETMTADGEDVVSVAVMVLDEAGNQVPTANNLLEFEVTGQGRLLGVGNGDPSSHETEKGPTRRLFNGLAAALVQSTRTAGEATITVRSAGLRGASLGVRAEAGRIRPAVP